MKIKLRHHWFSFVFILAFSALVFAFNFLEVRALNSFLKTLQESSVNFEKAKGSLILFLIITAAAGLLLFLNSLFRTIFKHFLSKFAFKQVVRKFLSQHIAKIEYGQKEEKIVAVARASDTLIDKFYDNILTFWIQIVSIIGVVVSLGILNPIVLSYLIPLIILVLLAPVLAQVKSQEVGKLSSEIIIEPENVTSKLVQNLYSYANKNDLTALEAKYIEKMDQLVVKRIGRFANKYAMLFFLRHSFSAIFYTLNIFITFVLAIFAPEYMAISFLATFVSNIPTLKNNVSIAINLFFNMVMGKMEFDKYIKSFKISNEQINNLPNFQGSKKSPKHFEKLRLTKVTILDNQLDSTILKEVNFELNKNEKILIFGESGSGKSTFVNHLLGLLPFKDQQSISINDDPEQNHLAEFAFPVWEKSEFITGTLLENLTLFDSAKEPETKVLMEKFKLKDINLQENVNIHNLQYSQGQMQRMALIRAFNSDQDILILDEAISNIDKKNVEPVLKHIFESDKTIIMISHNIDPEIHSNFTRIYEVRDGGLYEVR
ncbi:ATP-binding cassette domain-containing protein [Mycoplasmopsis glycophila]|uniref:ABC transporter, ATP-binding protein n=1 Tax=Mycoplasmopsis glycophila TaxID=171285 RepID=A0A449AUB5_9BACT|nr:ATP-binding cassette domain-containing protein [Mycoplasmopsis glycophila]VEU70073.1 ABC transporter, ATP-binding protein [Mycoplasmopsis glycophila]